MASENQTSLIVFIIIIALIVIGIIIYSFFFESKVSHKSRYQYIKDKISDSAVSVKDKIGQLTTKCDCESLKCNEKNKGLNKEIIPRERLERDEPMPADIDDVTNQKPMLMEGGNVVEAFDVYS